MRKKFFTVTSFLFVLLSFSFSGLVKADLVVWSQTYGGTAADCAYSVVESVGGGYAIAGYTYSTDSGGEANKDFWLVKTDEFGNMEWSQEYGGDNDERAYSLVATSDGGYAMTGVTQRFGSSKCWLVKTDSSGNMEWNKTYGGTIANALINTSDGGYAIAGYKAGFNGEYNDYWLVKTDSGGNLEWEQTYGLVTYEEKAHSVVETFDGGYAIAGYIQRSYPNSWDYWLVKTNATGHMEWNQTYEGAGNDKAYSLVQTSDEGYVLAGCKGTFGGGDGRFFLVKANATGYVEWNQTYGGTEYEAEARSLVETSDGGYAIAGYILRSGSGGYSNFWLVKTDSYGNMEWNQEHGGNDDEKAYSLVTTSDGGYILAGDIGLDFLVVKTDEYGVIPEFHPWMIAPLLAVATLVSMMYKKRLSNQLHKKTRINS